MPTHDPPKTPGSIALFGRDHVDYGRYDTVCLNRGTTACTISVGADPKAASRKTRGGADSLNEDALYACDLGDQLLVAVADAHFGRESSHWLIAEISRLTPDIPREPQELQRRLRSIQPSHEALVSASTLLVAVYQRSRQHGFGFSLGDSSLAIVAPEGARVVNLRSPHFLSPATKGGLDWDQADPFVFFAGPGSLLLAFSDGINECHYRSPRSSVAESHLHQLFREVGPRPELYARRLTELALAGVDGNPGGEDNICLAVSQS